MTQSSNCNPRIWTWLHRSLFALAAIAPCGMAAVLALLVYPRGSAEAFYGWPTTGAVTELAGLAVSVSVVAALVLAYLKKPRFLLAAVALGVALRVILAVALLPGLVPYSDFAQVWQIATGAASEQTVLYKSFFPEWCNYIAVVHLLVDGAGLTYGGPVLASVALGFVVVGEVYLLARIVAGMREVGLLAASIYALMPSQVIYALIPAPDMLSMVFLLGAACLLAWHLSNGLDTRGFVGAALLAGLLIGVGSSFKPIGLVLAIAYVMALGIKCLASSFRGWARIGRAALSAVVVLGLAAGIPQSARIAASEVLDIQIARSATASYLCIGLNTEGEGQIHFGSKSRFYNSLRMSGVDEDEAAARTFEMLRQDWAENTADLSRLFFKKVVWAWQDDMSPAQMLAENSVEEEGMSTLGKAVLCGVDMMGGTLSQGFYLVTMALAAFGSVREARSREEEGRSDALPFLALFILGFFCLLLFSEAQSRYKSNVLPYIAVFSALGVPGIVDAWMSRQRLASAIAERLMALRSSRVGTVLARRVDVPWARVAFAALAYMFLPVAIFFLGWTRWYVALPCLAAFAFAALRFLGSGEFRSGGGISLCLWQIATVAAIELLTGWVCGWLGNVAQPGDWLKHNALLLDLMHESWPVYYRPAGDGPGDALLLHRAVPGARSRGQADWIVRRAVRRDVRMELRGPVSGPPSVPDARPPPRRGALVPIVCLGLVLFNCALFLSQQLVVMLGIEGSGSAVGDMWLRGGSVSLQYRSFLVALRWVPQQMIVPWMAAGLFMRCQRSVRHWVFLLLPSILFGTLSFVGLFLMAVSLFAVRLARRVRAGGPVLPEVREAFSAENLAVSLFPGCALLLYFMGNISGPKPDEVSFGISVGSGADLVAVLTCLASYLVYFLLVLPDARRRRDATVLAVIAVILGVIPFFRMGWYNDWCMCVSLCPLFVLAVYVHRSLLGEWFGSGSSDKSADGRRPLRIGALAALVLVAALQPAREAQLALNPMYSTSE